MKSTCIRYTMEAFNFRLVHSERVKDNGNSDNDAEDIVDAFVHMWIQRNRREKKTMKRSLHNECELKAPLFWQYNGSDCANRRTTMDRDKWGSSNTQSRGWETENEE